MKIRYAIVRVRRDVTLADIHVTERIVDTLDDALAEARLSERHNSDWNIRYEIRVDGWEANAAE